MLGIHAILPLEVVDISHEALFPSPFKLKTKTTSSPVTFFSVT